MSSRPRLVIGTILLLVVLLAGGGIYLWTRSDAGPSGTSSATPSTSALRTVACAGGSEKSELLADPQIQTILRDSYGLAVDWTPMGSYKVAQLPTKDIKAAGYDCLWPSSTSAQLVFEAQHHGDFPGYRAQNVLQSPEVIYTGPQAHQALRAAGLVTTVDGHEQLDIKKLVEAHVLRGTTWKALKAGDLDGPVVIGSTDARTSNSGFTITQLVLTVMATADANTPPTLAQARKVMPQVRRMYDSSGLQASSSDNGFNQWISQGGEYSSPLYAGYESQIIQLSQKDPNAATVLKDIVTLYPAPTLYSDHPILALDDKGRALAAAMADPKIQQIAWRSYGFRSRNAGVNDVTTFKGLHLANRFRTVRAPSAEVTLALIRCLDDAATCS